MPLTRLLRNGMSNTCLYSPAPPIWCCYSVH